VATVADVADYLRISREQARGSLDRLEFERAQVEGWKDPAWLATDQPPVGVLRPPSRARFVGPFDNLIWYRARVKRIFGFEHTLEAYVPAAKRVHGYYVCPLLAGTRLVGRADLATRGGVLTIIGLSFVREDDRSLRALASAVKALSGLVGASAVAVPEGATWARGLATAAVAGDLGEGVRMSV
jgi:uncharacterized protein YcaQ